MNATEETFNELVLGAENAVLVDFYADWCPPCRQMEPILKAFAVEWEGHVDVVKVNVDDEPQVATEFGVRSMPTFLLFKDGKVVETLVGAMPRERLSKSVTAALA